MSDTPKKAEFPWQVEYRAWALAQPKPSGALRTVAEWDRILPKAKASDVIAVALEALEKNEIYQEFVSFADRLKDPRSKFLNIHGELAEEWDDEGYKYACKLATDYYKWWRIKKGLEDNLSAYSGIPTMLLLVAKGNLDAGNVDVLKQHLFRNQGHRVIDDVGQIGDSQ